MRQLKVVVSFTVFDYQRAKLQQIAREQGESVSHLVRNVLDQFPARHR